MWAQFDNLGVSKRKLLVFATASLRIISSLRHENILVTSEINRTIYILIFLLFHYMIYFLDSLATVRGVLR